jgi:beta-phosphoglucomutase-like phosphatase (HAD superfamily)
MFLRAARELGLDLSRSILVGDRWRDVAAAPALGARGILVPTAETPAVEIDQAQRDAIVVPTLAAAVDMITGE